MRYLLGFGCVMALAACDPPVPDSGAGVGFVGANLNPRAVSEESTAPVPETTGTVGSDVLSVLQVTAPTAETPEAFVDASPSNPAPLQVENSGISDENDFAAVDSRRSIEDDAQRRAEIAAQYQQIEATDLPDLEAGAGPNIVEYAILSDNPLGNRLYRRLGINAAARYERNCRSYPSADQAQIDFLTRGGPERDPRGLDPDGDGYACSWDPTPFQKLRR